MADPTAEATCEVQPAPDLEGISIKFPKNTLSSPIETYSKGPPIPRPSGSRAHAQLHHIFSIKGRPAGREGGSPKQPAGHCVAGRPRREATGGGDHQGYPLVQWGELQLEPPPRRAASAHSRRSPIARPEGGRGSRSWGSACTRGYQVHRVGPRARESCPDMRRSGPARVERCGDPASLPEARHRLDNGRSRGGSARLRDTGGYDGQAADRARF